MRSRFGRTDDGSVLRLQAHDEHVVERALGLHAERDADVPLRVGVDEEHLEPALGEPGGDADGGRGLAGAALVVEDGEAAGALDFAAGTEGGNGVGGRGRLVWRRGGRGSGATGSGSGLTGSGSRLTGSRSRLTGSGSGSRSRGSGSGGSGSRLRLGSQPAARESGTTRASRLRLRQASARGTPPSTRNDAGLSPEPPATRAPPRSACRMRRRRRRRRPRPVPSFHGTPSSRRTRNLRRAPPSGNETGRRIPCRKQCSSRSCRPSHVSRVRCRPRPSAARTRRRIADARFTKRTPPLIMERREGPSNARAISALRSARARSGAAPGSASGGASRGRRRRARTTPRPPPGPRRARRSRSRSVTLDRPSFATRRPASTSSGNAIGFRYAQCDSTQRPMTSPPRDVEPALGDEVPVDDGVEVRVVDDVVHVPVDVVVHPARRRWATKCG